MSSSETGEILVREKTILHSPIPNLAPHFSVVNYEIMPVLPQDASNCKGRVISLASSPENYFHDYHPLFSNYYTLLMDNLTF